MITSAAMKNGFTGGLIVDFPNSKKAKKYFLFLMAGYSEQVMKEAQEAIYLPKARTEGEDYNFKESDSEEEDDGDSDMDDNEEEKNEEDDFEDEDDDDDEPIYKKKEA